MNVLPQLYDIWIMTKGSTSSLRFPIYAFIYNKLLCKFTFIYMISHISTTVMCSQIEGRGRG